MKIIYNKDTGNIVRATSKDQDYRTYFEDWGEEFINNLESVNIDNVPTPLWEYHIQDGEIVKYNELEIKEKELYGKVLTDEERQLNKLKPSPEEIRKAENTIEILTLIREVI